MNTSLLEIEMIKKKISKKDLQIAMGISRSAFYRKMTNDVEFSREEIKKIIKFLDLTDKQVMNIFFDDDVS